MSRIYLTSNLTQPRNNPHPGKWKASVAMYAFDALFSLGRFLCGEDFEEDEREPADELGEALAAFASALLGSEAARGSEELLAEEAKHFWREVGTASLDEARFMKLSGTDLLASSDTFYSSHTLGNPKSFVDSSNP